MKNFIVAMALFLTAALAYADSGQNIIRMNAPILYAGSWAPTAPAYGDWVNVGAARSCSTWAPAVNTVLQGTSFTQSNSCLQNQERTVQDQELNQRTQETRAVGLSYKEQKTATVTNSRIASGTQPVAACSFANSSWLTPSRVVNGVTAYFLTVTWQGVVVYTSPDVGDPTALTQIIVEGTRYTRGNRYSGTTYFVCKYY